MVGASWNCGTDARADERAPVAGLRRGPGLALTLQPRGAVGPLLCGWVPLGRAPCLVSFAGTCVSLPVMGPRVTSELALPPFYRVPPRVTASPEHPFYIHYKLLKSFINFCP